MGTEGRTIAVLDIPRNTQARINFIANERLHVIQRLALWSAKPAAGGQPVDEHRDPGKPLYQRLNMFLRWLDEEVQMTPEMKQKTMIERALKVMFAMPEYHFPPSYVQRAIKLFEKWEAENWGHGEVLDDSEPESQILEPANSRQAASVRTASADSDMVTARLPPDDHPIYGRGGIMRGLALKSGQRKVHVYHPDFPPRDPKIYGSNGFANGQWYPLQLLALSHGAHGARQAGISGNSVTGAYSVVISGQYHELDQDYGETVYYSGSNSHNNDNPRTPAPSSGGTLVLHASLSSGRPIRVLRSRADKSVWAPSVGIRYDGLYRVVEVRYPINRKGGMYEQFKLQREVGQLPIDRTRPTPNEIRDFEKIALGY